MAKASRGIEEDSHQMGRPARGARALQSERRRQDILKASGEVLSQGFADFSLRKVAAAADVRLNTVQHHFKDLDSLIYATLDFVGRELLTRFMELGQGQNEDPIDDLLVFLDEAWVAIRKADVRGFFFELWTMALHRPVVEGMVKQMYSENRASLVTIIQRVNPALTAAEANVLARLICSWTEGALVMAHWGEEGMPSSRLLSIRMKSACLALLGVADPAGSWQAPCREGSASPVTFGLSRGAVTPPESHARVQGGRGG